MFSINGARRRCNNWLYHTEDKQEIVFLKNNAMFEAIIEKEAEKVEEAEEVVEIVEPVIEKKKKGMFNRG